MTNTGRSNRSPAAGSRPRDGDYIFQIETGERRFWAACLQYAAQDLKEEPLLRVEVVTSPTRMRQVLENRHAEPPSAVGQACEVASLILAELGVAPQAATADEFEYFRQARAQRMPPGLWEKIMPDHAPDPPAPGAAAQHPRAAHPAARPGRPLPRARTRAARGAGRARANSGSRCCAPASTTA